MMKRIKKMIKSIPSLHSMLYFARVRYRMWYYGRIPIEQYPKALKRWYLRRTGEILDLDNPKTFNEKIQWLKLNDSTPEKTVLADKYRVRAWVANKIGDEHLIPLLGVWDNANDIDFEKLPNQFVLKATHSSGWNIIVRNKDDLNVQKTRKTINRWLKLHIAFQSGFELHYKNIPPAVIAEKYIENVEGDLYDYKFGCFNGEPKYCLVDMDRHTNHKRSIRNLNFDPLPFTLNLVSEAFSNADTMITKPEQYDQMITLARSLSEGFKYVRVDFYNVKGIIYFGEMTFTSGSGTYVIQPREYETLLGDMIELF